MSEIGIEELATILQQDSEFLTEHYEELIEKYPGLLVAIDDGKVVAVGEQEVKVYCAAHKNDKLVAPLVLSVPHKDELMPFLV